MATYNRPQLYMICGVHKKEKTEYINSLALSTGADVISFTEERDNYRATHNEKIKNEKFQDYIKNKINEYFSQGKSVIYDAFNINRKMRATVISMCPKYVGIQCHIVWHSFTNDKFLNTLRDFEPPFYDEGIHAIRIVKNKKTLFTTLDFSDVDEKCEIANFNQGDELIDKYFKEDIDYSGTLNISSWFTYGEKDTSPCNAWAICHCKDMYDNTTYYKKLPANLRNILDEFDKLSKQK